MPRIISNFFTIASETITHIKICFYSYKKFIIFFNKLRLQKHVIYSKIAFMKKIAISFFTLIFATSAALANANPFMGEHNHQIALNAGAGVNSGFIVPPPTQFVPFVFLHFQYSQPTTFFKVPARQSIHNSDDIFIRRHCDCARKKLVFFNGRRRRPASATKRTPGRKVAVSIKIGGRLQNK